MSSENAFGVAVSLYLLGILCGVLGRKASRVGFALCAIASGFLVLSGVDLLISRQSWNDTLSKLIPFYGLQCLRMDSLSAFFEIVIGVVGCPVAIYSIHYADSYAPKYSSRVMCALFGIGLLSLALIPVSNDVLTFMIVWEVMVLTFSALVAFEYEDQKRAEAALLMLTMSEGGTALFLISFLILWHFAGSPVFSIMESKRIFLPMSATVTCFLLAFFGFGVKAGIIPLHIWLPKAHPSSPSNISALLSAVVVKMGIYGVLRFFLMLLPNIPWWLGAIVIGFGSLTAIVGILYALLDTNIKSLLAYSTIENVGIIFVGIGAFLIFRSVHLDALAGLALLASLFHLLSHAVSKGTLFLGAGAVRNAIGHDKDMDDMGGLIRRMPWTSLWFLLGTLGIAAIPPFSGYVGEWFVLESLIQGVHVSMLGARLALGMSGVILALTAGLAITCFVRTFGTCFLALPRTRAAENACEAPGSMCIGQGVMALSLVGVGVLAANVIPLLGGLSSQVIGADVTGKIIIPIFSHPLNYSGMLPLGGALGARFLPGRGQVIIPVTPDSASTSPLYIAGMIAAFLILISLLLRLLNRPARTCTLWAGGVAEFTSRYEYTSTGYVHALQLMFRGIYQPRREVEIERHEIPHRIRRIVYRNEIASVFEERLYRPALQWVQRVATFAQRIQSGSVSLYAAYILAIFVIVLLIRAL